MDLKETVWEGVDRIILSERRDTSNCLVKVVIRIVTNIVTNMVTDIRVS